MKASPLRKANKGSVIFLPELYIALVTATDPFAGQSIHFVIAYLYAGILLAWRMHNFTA